MKNVFNVLRQKLAASREHAWVLVGFICLLIAYHMIYGQFFPNRNGNLGHDWVFISGDLSGLYSLLNATEEGMVWGSPYLCGGIPGGVEQVSYWLPSILNLVYPKIIDPVQYYYIRMLMYVSVGFWGTLLLCRSIFRMDLAFAFLAGALFMFNGFVPHRMIIGHHGYIVVMLVPLFAWLLLKPIDRALPRGRTKLLLLSVLAGLMTAHMAAVEAATTVPIAITIAAIMALAVACGVSLWTPLLRSGIALVIGLLLTSSRLVGATSDVQLTAGITFRQALELPGLATSADTLAAAFKTLFLSPPDIAVQLTPLMKNMRWYLDRHEWEYGITVIPLVLLALGIAAVAWRWGTAKFKFEGRVAAAGAVFLVILALPLALNTWHSTEWSTYVKSLPFISANSTLVRWFAILMLPTILVSTILASRATENRVFKYYVVGISVFFLVILNSNVNREYYHAQPYNPSTILAAFKQAQKTKEVPPIRFVGAYQNDKGEFVQPLDEANLMVQGVSGMGCFLGNKYSGRNFPLKTLHPGSIMEEQDGYLNIKNPACYVYPAENGCTPGDHFRVEQKAEAEKFASYRPFKMNVGISTTQRIFNWVTIFANIAVWAAILVLLVQLFRNHGSNTKPAVPDENNGAQ